MCSKINKERFSAAHTAKVISKYYQMNASIYGFQLVCMFCKSFTCSIPSIKVYQRISQSRGIITLKYTTLLSGEMATELENEVGKNLDK